jgi:hypothetical protein
MKLTIVCSIGHYVMQWKEKMLKDRWKILNTNFDSAKKGGFDGVFIP